MSGLQPKLENFDKTVTATAAVINSDSTYREEVTLFADEENTQNILIGDSASQTFPLPAGYWVTIKKTSFELIYAKSVSGSQTLHVICGGN